MTFFATEFSRANKHCLFTKSLFRLILNKHKIVNSASDPVYNDWNSLQSLTINSMQFKVMRKKDLSYMEKSTKPNHEVIFMNQN